MSRHEVPPRIPFLDEIWRDKRRGFVNATFWTGLLLQILVLGNLAYMYGSTFKQSSRVRALDIVVVNADGGPLGEAVTDAAYTLNNSGSFPTLRYATVEEYPDFETVRQSVCRANHWAAIVVNGTASSNNSHTALQGSTKTDDPSGAITYVYNQARYPLIADSVLLGSIKDIILSSRLATLLFTDAANTLAVWTPREPIGATSDLITAVPQPSRMFYNTLNLILPPLAQFFFIMAMNNFSRKMSLMSSVCRKDVWMVRFAIGKLYSFASALAMVGCMKAFREVGYMGFFHEFGRLVALFWILMDIHWLIMEALITSCLPMEFTPFFALTWLTINVTSALFPFELMPAFYKVGYALPSRQAYVLMTQIWSGCGNATRIALPVLLAWWLIGHIAAFVSIRTNCNHAHSRLPGPTPRAIPPTMATVPTKTTAPTMPTPPILTTAPVRVIAPEMTTARMPPAVGQPAPRG